MQRLRQQNAWTLEELADRTELHRTHLSLVERGQRGLTLTSALQLASAFGMTLSDFIYLAETGEGAQAGSE